MRMRMRTRASVIRAALFAGLALVAAGRARQTQSGPPASGLSCRAAALAHPQKLAGVRNFGEVTPTLYRGGQPSESGFRELAKLGVRVVVNLRPGERQSEAERETVASLGMQYVWLPWNCRHPSNQTVAEFLRLVHDKPGTKIFVHCHHGVDRTGLLVATYRMAEEDCTSAQALKEMRAYHFSLAHRTWCHALESYARNFPTQLATDPQLRTLRPPADTPPSH
jgi:tyrosine-protein phosphatase SIW14